MTQIYSVCVKCGQDIKGRCVMEGHQNFHPGCVPPMTAKSPSRMEMERAARPAYRVLSEEEKAALGYGDYDFLVGPDGFECFLGEPEDRIWYRDASAVVTRLNKQHADLLDAQAKLAARERPDEVVVAEGRCYFPQNSGGYFEVGDDAVICSMWAKDSDKKVRPLDGQRVAVVVRKSEGK